MTKVKICGLTRLEDIESANLAQPDYVGFVFAPSKRQITGEQAKQFKQYLSSNIQTVGVFVNASLDEIIHLCVEGVVDLVQLHGDEDVDYIETLSRGISQPIIKAVRMKHMNAMEAHRNLPVSYFLLDTYAKEAYGGTGHAFDWEMIGSVSKPFFFAGGLHIGNVEEAIRIAAPYCVDVSSGVETNGIKDKEKMIAFVKKVRGERDEER